MAQPPRDENGIVAPHNDPDILDDDGLIRYIHPRQVIEDKHRGCKRVSSGAFSPSSTPPHGMSVDLERPLVEAESDNLARLPDSDHGAVRLRAGDMRELNHRVGSNPVPNNPYHGEVWDIGPGRRARRRIQDKAETLKKPSGLD